MPHDRNGVELKAGDKVSVEAEVQSVCESGGGCNGSFKVLDPSGSGEYCPQFTCNTGLVVKLAVLLLLLTPLLGGCVSGLSKLGVTQPLQTLSDISKVALDKVADGSVLEDAFANANASTINPKLVSEACVCARTSVGIEGIAANADLNATFDSTRLPKEVREAYIKCADKARTVQELNECMAPLMWNRTPAGGNTNPGAGGGG